ncbi:MAG: hypothetical protein JWM76_3505 [Pseudonocardiales bacterium]|nr:hypothetical protein [Pseudonocardiales bacterium]
MILGAAFCPHPPLLVPSIAGSATAEVADLLAACDAAVAELVAPGVPVVVLGSGDEAEEYSSSIRGSIHGFGPPDESTASLPLALMIGRWLLDRAGPSVPPVRLILVPDRAMTGVADIGDASLLVMGDGSARRGLKAPGYLDERAFAFDDEVGRAMRAGDASALATVDLELAAELLCAGAPAWRAAGRLMGQQNWTTRVTYDADPFGVSYRVACWLPTSVIPDERSRDE